MRILLLSSLLFFNTLFASLQPCHFRVGVRGGGSPTWFTHKTQNILIDNTGITGQTVVPDFNEIFHLPWTVGGFIGYSYSPQIELFLDGEYTHAEGKTRRFTGSTGLPVQQIYDSYNHWALYLGARYFICDGSLCGWGYSPFFGAKLGVKHYSSNIDAEIIISNASLGARGFYEKYTVPSIGGQLGIEFFYNCRCSLSLMLEAIYSGQMRSVINSFLDGGIVPNISVGDTGPLFSLPFTIGLNYTL